MKASSLVEVPRDRKGLCHKLDTTTGPPPLDPFLESERYSVLIRGDISEFSVQFIVRVTRGQTPVSVCVPDLVLVCIT